MKKILILASLALCWAGASAAENAVTGKTIHVQDQNVADWTGTPPNAENESSYSEGEFIWKDAARDDTGNGNYTYPLEPVFEHCADLREVRVTFDKNNLYLFIKTEKPRDWWVPYRVVAIRTDLPGTNLLNVLPQGETSSISNYQGMYGEIKVSPDMAPHFVIGLSGTFKGRIWDGSGKLIGKADGADSGSDTAGFQVATFDWCNMQVAIPWKLLKVEPPQGKTWKFLVGVGIQDYDHLREVDARASQWHGGGGEGSFNEDGVDCDLYDLASPSSEMQQQDLGGFAPNGSGSSDYPEIKNSWLEIKFGKLK